MALHKDLTGADLHEPKGASSASANTILKADGLGSSAFVSPLTLTNIQYASVITNQNSGNILPASLDVPITAGFDSTVANSDVSINSSGLITILTSGLYACTFNLGFGRITATGTAILAARLLKNGSQFGFTQGSQLPSNLGVRPMQANLEINLAASDTLQVQLMRDSAGVNEGGFVSQAITDAGWGDIPSYWVRIRRIIGAS